jgi:hypothetical protein
MQARLLRVNLLLCLIGTCVSVDEVLAERLTVTFDPPSLPGGSRSIQSYLEKGIEFTGTLDKPFAHCDSGVTMRPDNGTAFLQVMRYTTGFRMKDGSLFNVLSVDLAEYSTAFAVPMEITLRGHRIDSSIVVETFTIDGVIDGAGHVNDFERFVFDNDFRNLKYVEINSATFSMDNLTVETVPEPGTILMLGLGTAIIRKRVKVKRQK